MIEVRAESLIACDIRGKHLDFEAKLTQESGEQTVQLITETAAPSNDNLCEQLIVIKHDRLAGVNAQVFKWNSAQMSNLERAQCLRRRFKWPLIIDPIQVALNVH